jgi:hypothetical protein
MNFTQLHERLRTELQRRIDRGVLTGTLLARQTGISQAHISNFLRRHRMLSAAAADRILLAQSLTLIDLAPHLYANVHRTLSPDQDEGFDDVPLVSHAVALHDPSIPRHAVIQLLRIPAGMLETFHPRRAAQRREWQRFVAIQLDAQQAEPMRPHFTANSLVLLDRHYNSLASYRAGQPNIYAVRSGNALLLRHVTFDADRLVLRPSSPHHPVEVLSLGPGETPADLLIGRCCLAFNVL